MYHEGEDYTVHTVWPIITKLVHNLLRGTGRYWQSLISNDNIQNYLVARWQQGGSYTRAQFHRPAWKHKKVAKRNHKKKLSSQTTMSQVQFGTSSLLISALKKIVVLSKHFCLKVALWNVMGVLIFTVTGRKLLSQSSRVLALPMPGYWLFQCQGPIS